jgi:class 3 adenylate cyclase
VSTGAPRGDIRDVDCPHCGTYAISNTTICILPGLIGGDRRKAVLLGHALRRRQTTDPRPLLKSDDAKAIIETETLPSVEAQADNTVRWLGQHSPSPGQFVVIALETHAAIIGTVDLQGFHFVLTGLKEDGLINWYATFGSKQNLYLTQAGWRRYEQLRAGARPTVVSRHRHAAVLATDMVGYSTRMSADEQATLAVRSACMSVVRKAATGNSGRLVKTIGDGTLNEFGSTVDAMRAALEILGTIAEQNRGKPEDKRVELRMGLAVGDVVVDEDNDILGDTVNLASRLEAVAAPGTVCTLEYVRDDLVNKPLQFSSEDLGPRELKGISRQLRVVQITTK